MDGESGEEKDGARRGKTGPQEKQEVSSRDKAKYTEKSDL